MQSRRSSIDVQVKPLRRDPPQKLVLPPVVADANTGARKCSKLIHAAPKRGRGKPSADDAKHGENHQRRHHIARRFVHVRFVLVVARRAAERHENQPEHIK